MTMRATDRAALREVLRRRAGDGPHLDAGARRLLAASFGISERTVRREFAALADELTGRRQAGPAWAHDEDHLGHVAAVVAASDTTKQAWRVLHADGTVQASYCHFTRQLRDALPPAVHGALTGDGREDYLRASLFCNDEVPGRNMRWQADGQEVPVWVRPDIEGGAPFKPWQITFADEATRMIMGTLLVPAPAVNADDVVAVLTEAIRGYETEDGTFVGGIPEVVRWDNGKEFINEKVSQLCVRLGIAPRPASPHAAHQKGKIERWHRTIQQELYAPLPGASDGPRSFTGRPEWLDEEHLLTFTGLSQRVQEWARSYNQDRVHASLTSTPFDAWRADPRELTYADPAMLHPFMLAVKRPRKVAKDGISYQNVKYTHPALRDFGGKRVWLRVFPNDVNTISVFTERDEFICDAGPASRLSAEQRRQLVVQRHKDYQQIKRAHAEARQQRRQAAAARNVFDPPATTALRPPTDALTEDDDALMALLEGDDQ